MLAIATSCDVHKSEQVSTGDGHLQDRNGSVQAESNLPLRSTQEWLREEGSSAQDGDLVLGGHTPVLVYRCLGEQTFHQL